MAEQKEAPYLAHVFVCTNDRQGARQSCADQASPLLKEHLKEAVKAKGWQGRIRVSTCGCMGLCAHGANVVIYPQKIWFAASTPHDAGAILQALETILTQEHD